MGYTWGQVMQFIKAVERKRNNEAIDLLNLHLSVRAGKESIDAFVAAHE